MESVQKLIRPQEQCQLCVKIKSSDYQGRLRKKLFALVTHSAGGINEHSVFILEARSVHSAFVSETLPLFADTDLELCQKYSLTGAAPVEKDSTSSRSDPLISDKVVKPAATTAGTGFTAMADLLIRLRNPRGELEIETFNVDDLQRIVSHVEQALVYAKERRQLASGDTHQWTAYYTLQVPSALELAPLTSDPGYSYHLGLQVNTTNPLVSLSLLNIDPRASLEDDDFDALIFSPASKGVKDAWILGEMRSREAQFTDYSPIRVFTGTWNVNGRLATQSLTPWLAPMPEDTELLVLGFQELDLRAEAYLMYDSQKEQIWCRAVEEGLGSRVDQYQKVVSKQLIGMLIVVYAHQDVAHRLHDVAVDSAGCGIMGMIGNKGAVAVRFNYNDSSFCIVNCHLAANMNQVERRNQDYHDLCRRIMFAKTDVLVASDSSSHLPNSPTQREPHGRLVMRTPAEGRVGASSVPSSATLTANPAESASIPPLTTASAAAAALATGGLGLVSSLRRQSTLPSAPLFGHDYVIWMGDLNYRIPLEVNKVKSLLDAQQLKYLQDFDQLNVEKANHRAFAGFEENTIQFPPTYKYEIGTSQYDPKRAPAWCDRILWWSPLSTDFITQRTYACHMELTSSDHKPVSSLFDVKTKHIRRDDQAAIHSQLLHELDRYENECMPTARVSETQLDFGTVEYEQPVTRAVTLHNTGKVPVQFRFIPKLDETAFCRPWLWVNPPTGIVLPGSQILIHFTVLVLAENAPALNTSREELRDILILHLENGKDYFISVQGNYLPTCFGTSLDVLARLPKPIRAMSLEEIQALGEETQYSIPKEIWRLVDLIYDHGLGTPHLFFVNGDPDLVDYIRTCLDTGTEWDLGRILPSPRRSFASRGLESSETSLTESPMDFQRLAPVDSDKDDSGSTRSLPVSTPGQVESNSPDDPNNPVESTTSLPTFPHSTGSATSEPVLSDQVEPADSRAPDSPVKDTQSPADSESEGEAVVQVVNTTSLIKQPENSQVRQTALSSVSSPPPEARVARPLSDESDRYLGMYSVADVLVRLLKYLPEPVIPFDYFDRCVEAGARLLQVEQQASEVQRRRTTAAEDNDAPIGGDSSGSVNGTLADSVENAVVFQVLDTLPRANLNVFVFVMSFMKEVVTHSLDPLVTRERIAFLLATVILRPRFSSVESEDATGPIIQRRKMFIKQFL
ncbi:hypothetical protein IWQ62_004724 [Dispira parvispora]|uniref:Rho-GAP domain-containing protein n=1 Tax=Dispira parvispora TaxID=1520584 RepID=A0A9W8ARB7_9FUNG|nr:hypothetical protein IWQ62_004724 [Dispira parvispora]